MKNGIFTWGILGALLLSSCLIKMKTIKSGEVGVKRKLGKYSDKPYTEGLKVFNPLFYYIQ